MTLPPEIELRCPQTRLRGGGGETKRPEAERG